MFDFIINFNWINLFAISASRIHIIINTYFFFSFSLTSHFISSICNSECMMSSILFIIFAFLFLMFENMFLIFISCIITFDFSRRKIVVLTTFLIQKSFDFNIFLLFSKIILNIIISLNLRTFIIFLRVVNVMLTFEFRVNVIISFAFIFCIRFIFWISLIYIINFIFLLSFHSENALMTSAKNVECVILKSFVAIFV